MNSVPVDKIRNIAFLGHQDTGKTSVLEAILFKTEQVGRLARVDDGHSNLDFTPEEIDRKISMKSKLVHADWNGHRLHAIDTPGYDDFVAERVLASAVVEAAVVCVKADSGVESGTQNVWRMLDAQDKPRFVLVNKMDKEHAAFDRCLEQLRALDAKVAPLHLPLGAGETLRGYVDVVENKAFTYTDKGAEPGEVPAELAAAVQEAREALMNAAAETSDELVEKFLESGSLSDAEFRQGLARGIATGTVYPVLVGAAIDGRGIAALLDALVHYAPSPVAAGPVRGVVPGGDAPVERQPSTDQPVAAVAFGALSESNVGDYVYLRVWSGSLSPGQDVLNANTGNSERIGPLYVLNGKNREEAGTLEAGAIGAAVKLKGTHVGNTLCDPANPFLYPVPEIPEPLVVVGIKARAKGDEDKLSGGLQRLHEEDPGFVVEVNPETHQTLLKTQGDAHQALVLGKLKRKFGVDVDTEDPRTPYRETIKAAADERYRHKKQTGGRGQFGEVHLKIEPLPRGGGFEFVDAVVGGVIPGKFIPAVEKGVREAMQDGVIAGCPVVDVRVTVDDGKHHPVDSSEAAFKLAASMAFKQAFPRAKPVLLEPIAKVTVWVPEEFMGDVMGDLSSRRGRIQGMEAEGDEQVIRAEVPLAELYTYSSILRSLTQGRGRHVREFSHYEEVPHEVAEQIMAAYKEAQTAEAK